MFRSGLLLFSLFFCGALPAVQTTPGQLIRVTTGLVLVDARVVNGRSGLPVPALQPDDFEIYEDGVRQEITHFSRDRLPLSIVLLLDVSDSMRDSILELYRNAFNALSLLNPGDEVALVAYGRVAQLIQDFTSDRRLLVGKILTANETYIGPRNTFLSEAVFQASAHLARSTNPVSRRILVAVTDDIAREFHPGHGRKQALDELTESAAALYGLVINHPRVIVSAGPTRLGRNDRTGLREFSDPTGGVVLPAQPGAIAARLGDLFNEIRSSYSIGYVPSNREMKGEFRKILVRLSQHFLDDHPAPELKPHVAARKGYFAGPGPSTKAGTPRRETKEKPPDVKVVDGIFQKPEQRQMFRALLLPKSTKEFHILAFPAVFLGPGGETLVRLSFLLQPDRMRLRENDQRYTGGFELLAAVFNQTGMIATACRRNFPFSFDEARYQEFLSEGSKAGVILALPPGNYEVRSVLRDTTGRGISTLREPLDVFPLSKELPSLSSIVLGRVAERPKEADGDGADYDPLRIGDKTIIPSLAEAYPEGSTLTVFFHVYNVNEESQYRLNLYRDKALVRASDAMPVHSGYRHPMNGYLLAPELPLSGLIPGSYEVEVEVSLPGGEHLHRAAQFRVD